MTTTVSLLRHGETMANREGLVLGTSDAPLTKVGRFQATMAAKTIAGFKTDALFSSPYNRAKETASYIQTVTDLSPVFLDDLREMNSGEMEGSDASRMKELYPSYLSQWKKDPANTRPPGGETLGEVHERAWNACQWVSKKNPNNHVVIVSHLFPIQGIICRSLGLNSAHYSKIKLDLGSISKIIFEDNDAFVVNINDTCHLTS